VRATSRETIRFDDKKNGTGDSMKRFLSTGLAGLLSFALVACGGGEADAGSDSPAPAPAAPPAAAPAAAPSAAAVGADWVIVDEAARTVTINLIAGETTENNSWNFNGFANGEATVVVPEGFTVTINFSNADAANVHSVAVLDAPSGTPPVMFDGVSPVFDGAITSNATSMMEATANGQSESISFTADAAGDYALMCLIPAHGATGMWIGFEVSATGESGLKM